MGKIRDYSCKCGYQKRIFVGAGLNGCNRNAILQIFPEEAVGFETEKQAGRVSGYLLSNTMVACPACKKIESVSCFSYQTGAGEKIFYKKECSECGKTVQRIKDEECVLCPECGQQMTYTEIGNWD